MSRADTEATIDRMAEKRRALGAEGFGAYAFLALGILASHQPEVVDFILRRADEITTPPTDHAAAPTSERGA